MKEILQNITDFGLPLTAAAILLMFSIEMFRKNMSDIKNKDLQTKMDTNHKETLNELIYMRKETNNILLVLAGKFLTKDQIKPLLVEVINSKFKDMQLVFYSKVDKNNIDQNYSEILDEIDLLIENSKFELESVIKQSSNEEMAKEIVVLFEDIFENYREYIRKLFYYYKENHNKNEAKRNISNLTLHSIQKCINKIEEL